MLLYIILQVILGISLLAVIKFSCYCLEADTFIHEIQS
jgi:hypothetical protein